VLWVGYVVGWWIVASEQSVLLLSRTPGLAPVLRRYAREHSLQFVRASDAASAYEQIRSARVACALLDLDTLGEGTEEFLRRVRGLRPDLRAVGFGGTRARQARPTARKLGLPLLARPLTPARLARALEGAAAPPPRSAEAARLLLDSTHEELRRRITQLTTLYQLGRAISESRDWSEALDYFLATLRDYLGVRGAALLLWSRESTVLAPRTVLGLAAGDLQSCVERLLGAYPVRQPSPEIHALDCYQSGAPQGLACNGHAESWHLTVLPLLYRRTPLGFLVLDKPYTGGGEFASELFFLQTIQTILGEEVANAVALSKLLDLKNFNAAVLDNVESGVLTVNEAGQVTFANRLGRQVLGLPETGALEAVEFGAHFPLPGGVAGHEFARTGRNWTGEARRADGRRVPVALRTRRIVDPSDSEPLVVVAFEDLTEQRQLEEQARRADRLRSLGELSAAIAHEVRNPLQGISLTLSNLEEHIASGGEPYVRVIFEEMERLNAIVGGILSFARPAPPMPADFELTALCARALELGAERAAQQHVRLQLTPLPADDRCEADEGQVLQVVLNFILNAVDASPPGGSVVLSAVPVLAAAGEDPVAWRIAVHDDGPGMPAEVRSKLFDPFFTTKSGGTGMGLAISQKIAEEHHGTISVDTGEGQGTTFTLELPRRFGAAGTDRASMRGTGEPCA
jgi:PAS domain S-box-containing protein